MILFHNLFLQAAASLDSVRLCFQLPQGGRYCMCVHAPLLPSEYKQVNVSCPQELRSFQDKEIAKVLTNILEPRLNRGVCSPFKAANDVIVMMYYVKHLKLHPLYPIFISAPDQIGLVIDTADTAMYLDFLQSLTAPVKIVFRNLQYAFIKDFECLIVPEKVLTISQPIHLVLEAHNDIEGLAQVGLFNFLHKHRPVHLEVKALPLTVNSDRLDGFFSLLVSLPDLKKLSIEAVHDAVILSFVKFLRFCPMERLTDLSLTGNFGDEVIIQLIDRYSELSGVRSLTLEGTFGSRGFKDLIDRIGRFAQLRKLKLSGRFPNSQINVMILTLSEDFDWSVDHEIQGYEDDSTLEIET